jgi:hypothetical protein
VAQFDDDVFNPLKYLLSVQEVLVGIGIQLWGLLVAIESFESDKGHIRLHASEDT